MKITKSKNKYLKNKLSLLIKKLQESIIKDKDLDDMTVIELEAMGFKVYPPSSFPEKGEA